MRAFSVAIVLSLLAGCATTEPVVEYRETVVPTRLQCVERDELPMPPEYATRSVSDDDTIEQVADAYMIERNQLHGYVAKLMAIIEGCLSDG